MISALESSVQCTSQSKQRATELRRSEGLWGQGYLIVNMVYTAGYAEEIIGHISRRGHILTNPLFFACFLFACRHDTIGRTLR